MKAEDVLSLLAARHFKDVFVPECKTGASYGRLCPRMDAWAMRRSWARPVTFAYEIKVSRQDFLQDEKWKSYLPYASQFYFAAAPGVIDPSELPADVGLVVASKNAKKLYTKKKAPDREVEIPEDLFRYVLMARTAITNDQFECMRETSEEHWRSWLKKKSEKQELGYAVSRRIRDKYREMESKVSHAEHRAEKATYVEGLLKEMGIESLRDVSSWDARKQLNKALNGKADEISESMRVLRTKLDSCLASLESIGGSS